jgi:indolepyruvate ferredoxin oxidoreductase alpha subunit
MKGVDAIADALKRYADRLYTVPGFPITELGGMTNAELVINEKTAL